MTISGAFFMAMLCIISVDLVDFFLQQDYSTGAVARGLELNVFSLVKVRFDRALLLISSEALKFECTLDKITNCKQAHCYFQTSTPIFEVLCLKTFAISTLWQTHLRSLSLDNNLFLFSKTPNSY